jgi:uncharacterized protein (TIGR00369 family)
MFILQIRQKGGGSVPSDISNKIRNLMEQEANRTDGAFGHALHIRFLGFDDTHQAYLFSACTEAWMRNVDGAVHGGFCAAIADHTMGIVANSLRAGEQIAPTIQLQISYHRPLRPEEELQVRVRLLSQTTRLIHLSAEAYCAVQPEAVCFSSNATYFCKEIPQNVKGGSV